MNPKKRHDSWAAPGPNHREREVQMDPKENYATNQNTQPQNSRDPTHSDGYTMIPPDASRRSQMLSRSQKEEEVWQRWKEENRPGPIQLPPERLGGNKSLFEVRQGQQVSAQQSKIQKKLKQEEMDRIRRQKIEKENQQKKAFYRQMSNTLEIKEKKKQEQRKELYQHEHEIKREAHLQKLERSSSVPMAASSSTPTSSWARGHEYREAKKAEEQAALQQMKDKQRRKSEIVEEKHKQEEEDRKRQMENERLRVNSAFLDRLEARGSGRTSELLPALRSLVMSGRRRNHRTLPHPLHPSHHSLTLTAQQRRILTPNG